jgi:hypothetical protein
VAADYILNRAFVNKRETHPHLVCELHPFTRTWLPITCKPKEDCYHAHEFPRGVFLRLAAEGRYLLARIQASRQFEGVALKKGLGD